MQVKRKEGNGSPGWCRNEGVVLALHKFKSDVWNVQYAGLCRYCRPRKWSVYDCCFPGTPDFDRVRRLLRTKNVVGIVTSLPVALPEDIRSLQPVVCFDCEESGLMNGCPYIAHDAAHTARLAVRELSALSLRNFAYAHAPYRLYWNIARREAFEREIISRGGIAAPAFSLFGIYDRRKLLPALARWISTLPKPCGVFAANDEMAMLVVSACRKTGFRVPGDVAVIGVDDNRSICTSTSPTLSSIAPDWEAGAFMAAATLDRMQKARPVGMRETFRPMGVIGRGSTARFSEAVNGQVVNAVDLIRARACSGLKARDVVRMMKSSRRLAELRFREVTGRSILEEIRRVRLENAKLLLSRTDVPMSVVANQSGWASLTSFCREFKQIAGLTPMDWRKKVAHHKSP
jgi:LacI family transcriptional regulator